MKEIRTLNGKFDARCKVCFRAVYRLWVTDETADIRRDCARAGISYFFKQLDGKRSIPPSFPVVREFPRGS